LSDAATVLVAAGSALAQLWGVMSSLRGAQRTVVVVVVVEVVMAAQAVAAPASVSASTGSSRFAPLRSAVPNIG